MKNRKENEVNYVVLTVKEFIGEVLPEGLNLGRPMVIGSIDGYAISISMQLARLFYESGLCDEEDGIVGLKCGTAEVEISVDTIDYIWRYNDGSYQIGFSIPVPDMTLMYI